MYANKCDAEDNMQCPTGTFVLRRQSKLLLCKHIFFLCCSLAFVPTSCCCCWFCSDVLFCVCACCGAQLRKCIFLFCNCVGCSYARRHARRYGTSQYDLRCLDERHHKNANLWSVWLCCNIAIMIVQECGNFAYWKAKYIKIDSEELIVFNKIKIWWNVEKLFFILRIVKYFICMFLIKPYFIRFNEYICIIYPLRIIF